LQELAVVAAMVALQPHCKRQLIWTDSSATVDVVAKGSPVTPTEQNALPAVLVLCPQQRDLDAVLAQTIYSLRHAG
jgi:hypothetical protein